MDSKTDTKKFEPNVDMSLASRKAWLVKVPNYLAELLDTVRPLQQIGTFKINAKENGSQRILFDISKELAKNEDTSDKEDKENTDAIPTHHKFEMSPVDNQSLSLFRHNEEDNCISFEGIVEQKGEFRPFPVLTQSHMNVYKERIIQMNKPVRQTILLDRSVTVFKPCSHKSLTFEKRSPIKICKKDRETVRNMLFELFEKHQYYRINDLVRLTQQPTYYLKEVMREMCLYNHKNPHKYMLELMPQFRHYKKALKQ